MSGKVATGGAGGPLNPVQAPILERTTTWTREGLGNAAGPLSELWSTRAYRIIVVYVVYMLGFTVLMPFLPEMQADFFASERAGRKMTCSGFSSGMKPPSACVSARSDVVLWQSWTAFATHAVLSVYLNPAIGTWSDIYGRRPFIAAGVGLMLLPLLVVLLYLKGITTLYWYWPASVVASSISSFTVAVAYLGDVISVENRTIVFGVYSGTFSISSILGSFINISRLVSDPVTASVISLITTGFATILTFTWLPESLPFHARLAARQNAQEAGVLGSRGLLKYVKNPFVSAWASLKILGRTKLFIKLTVTVVIVMLVVEESFTLMFQYLQETVGFNTMDVAISLAIVGLGGLFTLYILLWFLYNVCGVSEKWVLITGILAYAVEQVLMIFIRTKWQAFSAIALSTLGGLVFPAIQAIKSKSVGEEEQGAVQGALVGARSLATGVGPFFFLVFFKVFREGKLYFPGAPFAATAVLECVALIVACTITLPASFLEIQNSGRKWSFRKTAEAPDEDPAKVPLMQEV